MQLKAIQGHKSWWKIYDFSTAEIFDKGDDLRTSAITKTAVTDDEFGGTKSITYDRSGNWGESIQLVDDVQRNKKKRITKYHVTGVGWVDPKKALTMACNGEIDNARPVFPGSGKDPGPEAEQRASAILAVGQGTAVVHECLSLQTVQIGTES